MGPFMVVFIWIALIIISASTLSSAVLLGSINDKLGKIIELLSEDDQAQGERSTKGEG